MGTAVVGVDIVLVRVIREVVGGSRRGLHGEIHLSTERPGGKQQYACGKVDGKVYKREGIVAEAVRKRANANTPEHTWQA